MAPAPELSLMTTAEVAFTVGFHPEIEPSSLLNRNSAGPDFVPWVMVKSVVLLNTVPVGVPIVAPPTGGMVTTIACTTPVELYTVERPVLLSEVQNGPVPLKLIPHGFTR